MLKQKSKAFQSFLTFKSQVELQLGYKIKAILQTDWGGECCTSTYYLLSNGIIHKTSCSYTHQQNRRKHIIEHRLTLLA